MKSNPNTVKYDYYKFFLNYVSAYLILNYDIFSKFTAELFVYTPCIFLYLTEMWYVSLWY